MATTRATNYIGANIKSARIAKGMTQLALGLALGNSGAQAGAHVCRFEKGLVEPRFSTLVKIADVLGVTPDSLVKVSKQSKK